MCGRLHMLLGYAEMENNARQLAAEIAQLQILYTIYMIYIYGELGGGGGGNKKMPRKWQLMKSKRRDAAVEAS